MSSRCWTLSPSDVASLWEECPRCVYLEVARGFPRPRPVLSKLVAQIDAQMRACCEGRRTEAIAADVPAGVFERGERSGDSQVIDVHLPDTVYRCRIRGPLDALVRLDDGGYALVAVTTGERRPEHAAAPGRRLNAGAYALEHPAPGATVLGPITRLGMVVFEPQKFTGEASGAGTLSGGVSWVEIARDDGALFGFLAEVLAILERPEPPGGAALCAWCVYRDASRRTGL